MDTDKMPNMVGEWRYDPDPIKRAIYWLVDKSWIATKDFEEIQGVAEAIWPLHK